MMYDGYEFYDDMHEFKKMDREAGIMARRTEMQFFQKMGCMSKYLGVWPRCMEQRSLPPSG